MFAKTLGTNWFAKTMYWSLLKSAQTETEKLVTSRSRSFIYTGRKYTGKFKFAFVWQLHLTAIFFCSEVIYYYIINVLLYLYYITYVVTMLILRGKTTTWFKLFSSSCAATYLYTIAYTNLKICGNITFLNFEMYAKIKPQTFICSRKSYVVVFLQFSHLAQQLIPTQFYLFYWFSTQELHYYL